MTTRLLALKLFAPGTVATRKNYFFLGQITKLQLALPERKTCILLSYRSNILKILPAVTKIEIVDNKMIILYTGLGVVEILKETSKVKIVVDEYFFGEDVNPAKCLDIMEYLKYNFEENSKRDSVLTTTNEGSVSLL